MAIKYKIFKKVYVDIAKVNRQLDRKGLAAMKRIGAILRRASRRKIKKRLITAKMQQRLSDAERHNDAKKLARIRAAIARRKATVSRPGQPPIAHSPDKPYASIRDIRFYATKNNVVVGPAGGNRRLKRSNRITVPEILEFGGNLSIFEIGVGKKSTVWIQRDRDKGRASWWKTRDRHVSYAPRPFMNPTLKESRSAILETYAKMGLN